MDLNKLSRVCDSFMNSDNKSVRKVDKPVRKVKDALTSSDLRNMILALGLDPTGKSVDQMKQVISMARWAESNPGKEFPDQFDPMLAKDSSKATKDWINENFKSTDWILQRKANGLRSVLYMNGDTIRATSRDRSVKDFMFSAHQDNVLGFQEFKNPFSGKTTIDGELMCPKASINTGSTITHSPLQGVVALVHMNTKQSLEIQKEVGSLQYHAFDILFLDGKDVQSEPYEVRQELCELACKKIKEANPGIPLDAIPVIKDFESAWDVFQEFIGRGEEGVLAKKKSGKYRQGKRSSDLQKLKGSVTVDGFITGMVPSSEDKGFKDLIGGFRISSNVDGKVREIASVSNIPNDIRKEATILVDGKPQLNPDFLNKCVELIGQEISAKSNRLGSARIVEWRDDKNPEDCFIDPDVFSGKDWTQVE